jgi:D-threo-aldose 1-dehydrogenase
MGTLARREIGRTGLEVSVLGFGGAGIGNLYRELGDDDAIAAVREAYAAGVRYFDTAPYYGFGLSELRTGAALRGEQAGPADPLRISTKVGRRLVPTGPQDPSLGREGYFSPRPFAPVFDYSYESILQSHAESLERLGVSRVDILLCHDIGRMTHGGQHAERLREFVEGGYRAMVELKRAGEVRAIGLGVNESDVCIELLEHCELDCILLAGRYTLLEQPALAGLLPLCERRGVSIICGAPFNSGVLAAGSKKAAQTHYNYAPPPEHVIERVRQLEAACGDFDVPLRAAALQFPLGSACVSTVVAGSSNGAESREIAAMFAHPIPATFWRALRERGLVHADAPLPGIRG